MTLPENFVIPAHDQQIFVHLGIHVIYTPADLNLGGAVVYAINYHGLGEEPIAILHGDTLIQSLPQSGWDGISVHEVNDSYRWAEVTETADKGLLLASNDTPKKDHHLAVASGYFAFSSAKLLVKSITKARNNFIDGINIYNRDEHQLSRFATGNWLDFGHLQTYYQSRSKMTTQRNFNDLYIKNNIIQKTSKDANKMNAEASWFESLPAKLRTYCPIYIGRCKVNDQAGYEIENLQLSTLSDLFVFGRLESPVWYGIFKACAQFLSECQAIKPSHILTDELHDLFIEKTMVRLEQYQRVAGFDIHQDIRVNEHLLPSPVKIAEEMAQYISVSHQNLQGIMHGDFCMSNIFYDFRSQAIRVIDPRGYLSSSQTSKNSISQFGDTRYDIAKLYHSVFGLYDFIIGGFAKIRVDRNDYLLEIIHEESINSAQDMFKETVLQRDGIAEQEINAMTINLFLSMVPLHSDHPERQQAFIANAGRLYLQLEKG